VHTELNKFPKKIEDWEKAEGLAKRLALVVCCPTYFMAQQEVIGNPPKSFNR
jgi:hypothetical protein